MDKNNSLVRVLVVAVIGAALSLAFVFNATGAFAPQQTSKDSHSMEDGQHTASAVSSSESDNAIPLAYASKAKNFDEAKAAELRIALRDLWADHVVWTRLYIMSAAAGTPDVDAAAQRLLKNQEDIGDSIKPFYGEEAGDELTSLLKDHILIAVDLLNAAKAGDDEAADEAEGRWYDNADDIATFLSKANPENWPQEATAEMLKEHLALTKTEAVARLTGDYATDVETFDEIFDQSMIMADHLADGIVKQFPKEFR
ncbi:MAG TPA: hypothetical protein VJP79_05390 [Nitrososphaera sp.]|nr:hypothetical protein [Nitrososphaera sp.]